MKIWEYPGLLPLKIIFKYVLLFLVFGFNFLKYLKYDKNIIIFLNLCNREI